MQPNHHDGGTRPFGDAVTVLMMTHVLRNLPSAQHNAWVCSAGSKGYCATKEMLQNGIPGHTLLVESGDLRDVDASSTERCCLLVYCHVDKFKSYAYSDHIPSTVKHIAAYGNIRETPNAFLEGCTSLTDVDLGPLSQVSVVQGFFLEGCTGLTALDLSPLSQVTAVQGFFLRGCTGLTSVDLGPLSQVTVVQGGFLERCTGLTTLDLSPLSRVTEIQGSFLFGCTGLTGLDMGPLSRVTEVHFFFLTGCTGIKAVDHPPPLCNAPAGWLTKSNQWVRQ